MDVKELSDFCIVAKDGENWTVQAKTPGQALDKAMSLYKHVEQHKIIMILKMNGGTKDNWFKNSDYHKVYCVADNNDLIYPCFRKVIKLYNHLK